MKSANHNMLITAGYGQLAQPSVLFDSARLCREAAGRSVRCLARDNGGLAGLERMVAHQPAVRQVIGGAG